MLRVKCTMTRDCTVRMFVQPKFKESERILKRQNPADFDHARIMRVRQRIKKDASG